MGRGGREEWEIPREERYVVVYNYTEQKHLIV